MRLTKTVLASGVLLASAVVPASAKPITERLEAGEPLRIGFSNVPIWGFPDERGDARGFVNTIALGVLAEMGIDNVETTVTEWGGLIPGLRANRYDLITGGLYILGSRCENIAFSEPIGKTGDAFIVPAGNPQDLHDYQDVLNSGAQFVTYAGANLVEAARKEGLDDDQIMQVPGTTEVFAAVKAGRADVGGLTYFEAKYVADADDTIDLTDTNALPEWTLNWVGIGFRFEDEDFMAQFNEALAAYVGTDEMLASVAEYGYVEANLPGDTTTEWACANR